MSRAVLLLGEPKQGVVHGLAFARGVAVAPERLQPFVALPRVLLRYGIEGKHYELDEDGFYVNLDDSFGYEGFNTWNLRVNDFKLKQPTDVALQAMFDKYAALGEKTKWPNVNIWDGFTEDYTEYSAERAAVGNVLRQYLAPLQAGLVSDVDAAVEEFRAKVNDAGLDACREGFLEQWADYCAEYNYQ